MWSLAYRRSQRPPAPVATELARLIEQGRAVIIGPVRQEVLSGIRDAVQFNLLRDALRPFPDLIIRTSDYERAAAFFNRCRSHGIRGAHIDFLLCAVAARHAMSIFTTDKDFDAFAPILSVRLHSI